MAIPITLVHVGDVVRLKKPHPCGTNEWQVARVGADIRLKCCGCERSVMMERYEFDRRFRGFLSTVAERDAVGAVTESEDDSAKGDAPDDGQAV